jgi:hypothetical protein
MSLPYLPLIDGCLFLDNSAMELITTCPRSAEYGLLHRRSPSGDAPPLRYGGIVHHALAYRYRRAFQNKPFDEEKQLRILTHHFTTNPCEGEDWRNLNSASNLITAYNIEYTTEPFTVASLASFPFVERPFAIYIGDVLGIKLIYTGRIDLVVLYPEGLFVMDHKTSSVLGNSYWADAAMSPQQRGYCWAIRETLGTEPSGYIINVLASRKPSKTGNPIEFARQRFFTRIPAGQLDEWRLNLLDQVSAFLTAYRNGRLPMHQKMCVSKFGLCKYYPVCELPSAQRSIALYSSAYEDRKWSPLFRPKLTTTPNEKILT